MLELAATGATPKVLLCAGATDLRLGFDGLRVLVERQMGAQPLSGHLFVFCNRRADRLKVLWWDGSGLWVCAKRLEKGCFSWPKTEDKHSVTMRPEELAMLVNGLDVKQTRQ